jgi:hypothetical protein
MTIESEYIVTQVEADYYSNDGEDVGYYRDENYDFTFRVYILLVKKLINSYSR